MWVFFGTVGHPYMEVMRAEAGNRVQMAAEVMEIGLWEKTSMRQLNFIPEYRKYIALGNLGTIYTRLSYTWVSGSTTL